MTQSSGALAQNKLANPFGLVYGNAITSNQIGKMQIHPSGQILLAIDGLGYYQEKGTAVWLEPVTDLEYFSPN